MTDKENVMWCLDIWGEGLGRYAMPVYENSQTNNLMWFESFEAAIAGALSIVTRLRSGQFVQVKASYDGQRPDTACRVAMAGEVLRVFDVVEQQCEGLKAALASCAWEPVLDTSTEYRRR